MEIGPQLIDQKKKSITNNNQKTGNKKATEIRRQRMETRPELCGFSYMGDQKLVDERHARSLLYLHLGSVFQTRNRNITTFPLDNF